MCPKNNNINACTLMNSSNLEDNKAALGRSFKDMTRVSDINTDLWGELFMENKENIIDELELFMEDINKICDMLKKDNIEEMKSILNKSSGRRREMNDGKAIY